jgi:uncharacterized integral membrane protein
MRLLRRSDEEPPPAEQEPPAAEQEPPVAEPAAEEQGRLREWQPRLYLKLLLLFAVIAYAIGFVLENRKKVHLHFVFGTSRVSLIWLVLLSLGLGLLGGVLLSQLNRRRRRR